MLPGPAAAVRLAVVVVLLRRKAVPIQNKKKVRRALHRKLISEIRNGQRVKSERLLNESGHHLSLVTPRYERNALTSNDNIQG